MNSFGDLDIVFSSDKGRIRPEKKKQTAPKGDGIVRVSRETKGRKGKGMTIVSGVPLHPEGLRDLAKKLKQKCGTGGTVKDGVIEIQGDRRDLLVLELEALGYTVKRAGG
jgi:translation initiation factor 1